MELSALFPALIGAAAALATSAGEKLINRFFDKSARREAQLDEDLQVLGQVAFEVRDLATAYWANAPEPEREAIVVGSIVGRLTFISAVVDEIFKENTHLLREMHMVMNRFDTSCTDGKFGSKSWTAEPGRCREIEINAYTLVHQANTSRRKL